jgi:hypothetical protein
MDAAVYNFVAQRGMSPLRGFIVDPRVGRHLYATLPTRPVLGGLNESAADSPVPMRLLNIPALQEADRLVRIAAIGVRPEAGEDKSYRSWRLFGDK